VGAADFARLRIGIGRPNDKSQVSQYVLDRPSKDDAGQIASAIDKAMSQMNDLLDGNIQRVMNVLNAG
jgi:PTH1 family peptidyl-tRNA hydrolase